MLACGEEDTIIERIREIIMGILIDYQFLISHKTNHLICVTINWFMF